MNSFVGFLKTKYMVLYNNFGKDLIAEFSVKNNCYVLDICVAEDKLFAATNKGTIRVYSWPILEEHCEL